MTKKTGREKDSTGTPTYVMVSVLFALVVFALEGIKESIGYGQDHSSLRMLNLAFVGLGLALCFFWRRFQEGGLKQLTAVVYTLGLWLYLFFMVMGPLLFQGDDGRLLFVHQIGYIGLLCSGLGLLTNLFYDTRLVPSLMLATIAGLLTSLGSIWGLVPLNPQHAPHGGSAAHDRESEEGEIRSAEFSAHSEPAHGKSHAPQHGEAEDEEFAKEDEAPHGAHGAPKAHGSQGHQRAASPRSSHVEADELPDHEEEDDRTLNAIQQKARMKARQQAKGQKKGAAAPAHSKSALKLSAHDTPAAAEPAHVAPHWDYQGAAGPEAWAELDESFKTCARGQEQSPIDVPAQWPLQHDIQLSYRISNFEAIDNGHTVQYNVEAGNFMTLNGKRYELKQIHFHTPSEHFVGGRSSILEAHFVHMGPSGELAVLGSMIEAGLVHREYQKLWEFMPFSKNTPVKPRGKGFDPRDLLPADLAAFRYAGSLTTPPCSEKVTWSVLKDNVQLSQEQINRFRTKYRNNARPIQPLNNRH